MMMRLINIGFLFLLLAFSCQEQLTNNKEQKTPVPEKQRIVGGGCDGCELMYAGIPDTIDHTDTSIGWRKGIDRLIVSGLVLKPDGQTPVPGVIIYYWHTNTKGLYASANAEKSGAARHGDLRGWVQSDLLGRYTIYTSRPAPYPSQKEPAHIHLSVKEPQLRDEYYTDDLVFEDDPLLTAERRSSLQNRGGSGIMTTERRANVQLARHDIVLGMNIPDYPKP